MTQPKEMQILTDQAPRCQSCGKLLAIALARPWVLDCPRCNIRNQGA